MRWPTPPTGPAGAGITNTAPRPATTPATELGSHDQRSTTAVLGPSLRIGSRTPLGMPAQALWFALGRIPLDPQVAPRQDGEQGPVARHPRSPEVPGIPSSG